MTCSYRGTSARIVLLTVAVWLGTASAESGRQKVGVQEARKLVYEAVRVHDPRHKVDVSRVNNPYDPEYIYFEATWPNPVGSPHLGNFAVNPWTGDVYNADSCKLLTSPSLRKRQENIRKRLQICESGTLLAEG